MSESEETVSVVHAVGAIVVHPTGRLLLICRGRDPGAGTWTFPGGRLERDESEEDAVVREVAEETSLSVRVVEELGVFGLRADQMYAITEFLCVPTDPDAALRAGDDAKEARWVELADLAGYNVRPEIVEWAEKALLRHRALSP